MGLSKHAREEVDARILELFRAFLAGRRDNLSENDTFSAALKDFTIALEDGEGWEFMAQYVDEVQLSPVWDTLYNRLFHAT